MSAYTPEIGTLSSTPSAFLMRYRDSATTCWHQKMSLFPQPHLTDVILHLQQQKKYWHHFLWIVKNLTVLQDRCRCRFLEFKSPPPFRPFVLVGDPLYTLYLPCVWHICTTRCYSYWSIMQFNQEWRLRCKHLYYEERSPEYKSFYKGTLYTPINNCALKISFFQIWGYQSNMFTTDLQRTMFENLHDCSSLRSEDQWVVQFDVQFFVQYIEYFQSISWSPYLLSNYCKSISSICTHLNLVREKKGMKLASCPYCSCSQVHFVRASPLIAALKDWSLYHRFSIQCLKCFKILRIYFILILSCCNPDPITSLTEFCLLFCQTIVSDQGQAKSIQTKQEIYIISCQRHIVQTFVGKQWG